MLHVADPRTAEQAQGGAVLGVDVRAGGGGPMPEAVVGVAEQAQGATLPAVDARAVQGGPMPEADVAPVGGQAAAGTAASPAEGGAPAAAAARPAEGDAPAEAEGAASAAGADPSDEATQTPHANSEQGKRLSAHALACTHARKCALSDGQRRADKNGSSLLSYAYTTHV